MHFLARLIKFFLRLLIPALGAGLIVTASLYMYLSPKLPPVETLKTVKLQIPLRVFSQDLQLIGEFGENRRSPINFEQIPPLFVQAILSAEDDSFYTHIGVDFKGLLRAALELVRTGSIQSGGSTITMQVARNFFLTREQSFVRKFNEILLALRIEDEISKNDILTLYANKIYLGNRAYGVQAAARVYYGKSIEELNLPQLAMIAGLPKAPSTFNPLANPERALGRRNWILARMYKLGHIDKATYADAVVAPVDVSYHGPLVDFDAPYVAEMARQEAIAQLGLDAYTNGYSVITTIDSTLQKKAVQALRTGLHAYDWRHGYRGPEKNLPDPTTWLPALRQTPAYGETQPAVVTTLDDTQLSVQLADGSNATLDWDTSLKGLRRYVTENSRSAAIARPSDMFTVGDLVRVVAANNRWQLTQVPAAEAGLVALAPENGAIKALVGGYDFNRSHFNRVTQGERQPGSNFKPFIYATALTKGMTAATVINDAPVVFDDPGLESVWRPENDSGKFYGPTRLRTALYLSRNLVSIRVLRSLGIKNAIRGLQNFGFKSDELPKNLSLALGTHALTPMEIATGYTVFANGGFKVEPFLIERIDDQEGNTVYRTNPITVCNDCAEMLETNNADGGNTTSDSEPYAGDIAVKDTTVIKAPTLRPAPRVMDERVIYIVDSILKDVIRRGTGTKALALKRSDLAGKTGTTNGPRDAWFSGYNPTIVTTVWVGFDGNEPLGRGEYGGSAALPIWMDFMGVALAGKPETYLPQPDGLVSVRINPVTGQRAAPGDTDAIFELFLRENAPPPLANQNTPFGHQSAPLPQDIF